jgi:hypothetical protein
MTATPVRRTARLPFAALAAAILLTAAGCATLESGLKAIDRGFERASNATSFASWEHFLFSARMNGSLVILRAPVAQRRDAETAARQGGWWGDPVPVGEKD